MKQYLHYKFIILLVSMFSFNVNAQVASDYFVFKQGKSYLYRAIGKNKLGIRTTMIYQCKTRKSKTDGVLMYFENKSAHGVRMLETYFVDDDSVLKTYSKNEFGGETKKSKTPILKIPERQKAEWSYRENIQYDSRFISTIKTSTKTYTNVLVVTENTWHDEMLYRYEKRYYAKDIGLVKIEVYDGSGLRLDYESFEVI